MRGRQGIGAQGHARRIGHAEQPLDEEAVLAVAWNDGASRGATAQNGAFRIEPEFPFRLDSAMTSAAVGLEEGQDIAAEIDLRSGGLSRGDGARDSRPR